MRVYLDRFRSYGERRYIPIRPLTLLIGENSSGKTSVLAALKYVVELASGQASPNFNSDPFFLGGFNNIAHYRGGKYGRAKEFIIGLEEDMPSSRLDRLRGVLRGIRNTAWREPNLTLVTEVHFRSHDGDAVPFKYVWKSNDVELSLEFREDTLSILFMSKSDQLFSSEVKRPQPSVVDRTSLKFLEFALRNAVIDASRPKRSGDTTQLSLESATELYPLITGFFDIFGRQTPRTRSVVAVAPVRTRPQRSYDPTQLEATSEGDHLIKQLARVARSDPKRWNGLKATLRNYGRATGLFDDLIVKSLGRSDTDPFQILVTNSGREANITDVGYGVSQALPIMILLSEIAPRSLFLLQQPEVHLHPKAQAELGSLIAASSAENARSFFVLETHSDFIVDRVRQAISKSQIDHRQVALLFFAKEGHNTHVTEIGLSSNGEVSDPPEQYRDFFVNEAYENLKLGN